MGSLPDTDMYPCETFLLTAGFVSRFEAGVRICAEAGNFGGMSWGHFSDTDMYPCETFDRVLETKIK